MAKRRKDFYEYVDGGKVRPEWAGKEVPVPPQEIRARLRLPAKYALATLAPMLESSYPEETYATAKSFLAQWPVLQSKGLGPVFVGPAKTGTSYIAAALANEIVMRSQATNQGDVTMSWLSCFWVLRMVLDAKDLSRNDVYFGLRDAMMKNDLIVVDDLLSAADVPGGVPLIHTIYAYRYDHNLPIITTITTQHSTHWHEVERVYGKNFVERLRMTSRGFVGKVTE